MGRWGVVLCAAAVLVFAGCGGDDEPAAGLPDGVGYMPRDSAVLAVSTDLDDAQLERLEALLDPWLGDADGPLTLRQVLEDAFERDVTPLLGGDLLIALGPDESFGALETPDEERLAETVEALEYRERRSYRDAVLYEQDGGWLAVDGSTVVVSLEGEDGGRALEQAIDRQRDGGGHDPADLAAALPDVGGEPFLRLAGDPQVLVRELELLGGAEMPWIRAARSAGLAVRLGEGEIRAAARVETDPAGLSDDDLPLTAGAAAPEAGSVDGAIAAANRDQSRTTVFLASLARLAYPDSRFVRAVEEVEAELGISFEEEVLAQFNGPSASVATPDGAFAAVSDVADPDRMRELLPRLAPMLPDVLRGLQGLGNRPLLALLLFAPDAPLVPGALGMMQGAIDVRPLEGSLYEITGLDERGPSGEQPFDGPGTVVFGMLGDRFVVATDERRARAVASMPVSPVESARGAAVARADLSTWSKAAVEQALGFRTVSFGKAVGEIEASVEAVEARLRVEVP